MSLQSIGSDMELFAKNAKGEHIAICGKLGGTKEHPKQIAGMDKGFMIQEDNVAVEFNIPPATNKEEFVNNMSLMRVKIASILEGMGLSISTNASVSFDKKQLRHKNALVFGCEPDYDAWSMCENKKPYAKDECLRTCGGHIHVGTNIDMVKGVQNMDLMLGVPSVILDGSPEAIARRELYGKPGAMRPKPYGFEYRVLSNFWWRDDMLVAWVFDQTRRSVRTPIDITIRQGKVIQDCINTGNVEVAKQLVEEYKIVMPSKDNLPKLSINNKGNT
jgi:hypothetical protein